MLAFTGFSPLVFTQRKLKLNAGNPIWIWPSVAKTFEVKWVYRISDFTVIIEMWKTMTLCWCRCMFMKLFIIEIVYDDTEFLHFELSFRNHLFSSFRWQKNSSQAHVWVTWYSRRNTTLMWEMTIRSSQQSALIYTSSTGSMGSDLGMLPWEIHCHHPQVLHVNIYCT